MLRARGVTVVVVGGGCAVAVAHATACIPDLPADAMSLDADAPDGGAEAGATAWCGDGIVEEDEQCDPGPIAGEGGTQFCVGCQVICPLGSGRGTTTAT
jgi:hypothetical protein